MKIYNIVFSPTGETQKVADIVANELSQNIEKIDLSDINLSEHFLNGDLAIIAMPSFGGRAPKIAIERLKKIKVKGIKTIVITVYGNRAYEDTLIEMYDEAENNGFNVIGAISAVAEHSIVRKFAKNRPNIDDEFQLKSFAKKINEKLNNSKNTKPNIPGNRPYKVFNGINLIPKTSKKCNKCKLCAKKCPVGAININNVSEINADKCISCMRCVSICPQKAKKISKLITTLAGFAIKKACSIKKENELFL